MQISAVIITFNEAANIERCIRSLKDVADEVVVVDSLSADNTPQLAESLGARVISRPFPGHVEQKNFARDQAAHPWVLSLDADECLSEKLRQSILSLKTHPKAEVHGYTMNRLNNYAGHWVRHCGWYPDRKLRLWLKDRGEWTGKNPHDKFELETGCREGHLKGDLLHYSIRSVEHHKETIRKYSSIAARAYFNRGLDKRAVKRFFSPPFKFIQGYIFQLGFLDGKTGFQICWWSAWNTWLQYYKLHRLNRGLTIEP